MDSRLFRQRLIDAVAPGDWQRLKEDDPTLVVSRFNRSTLLTLRETEVESFPVSEETARAIHAAVKSYLEQYMAEQPQGHIWIILTCLYLSLLSTLPLHPQEAAHWVEELREGERHYLCPAREEGEGSVCRFCRCEKLGGGGSAPGERPCAREE